MDPFAKLLLAKYKTDTWYWAFEEACGYWGTGGRAGILATFGCIGIRLGRCWYVGGGCWNCWLDWLIGDWICCCCMGSCWCCCKTTCCGNWKEVKKILIHLTGLVNKAHIRVIVELLVRSSFDFYEGEFVLISGCNFDNGSLTNPFFLSSRFVKRTNLGLI